MIGATPALGTTTTGGPALPGMPGAGATGNSAATDGAPPGAGTMANAATPGILTLPTIKPFAKDYRIRQ